MLTGPWRICSISDARCEYKQKLCLKLRRILRGMIVKNSYRPVGVPALHSRGIACLVVALAGWGSYQCVSGRMDDPLSVAEVMERPGWDQTWQSIVVEVKRLKIIYGSSWGLSFSVEGEELFNIGSGTEAGEGINLSTLLCWSSSKDHKTLSKGELVTCLFIASWGTKRDIVLGLWGKGLIVLLVLKRAEGLS